MFSPRPHLLLAALCLTLTGNVATASAQDWNNYGGNSARNGNTSARGPQSANALWSNTSDFSIIAWHPFVLGDQVFTVRESGFPQQGGPANDAIVAYDLDSGAEQWRTTLPYGGDTNTEWIAWIGAARDGQIYASRSANAKPQPIRALDAGNGSILWTSVVSTEAWAHDGIVFAPNGDLIVGDFRNVYRIDKNNGATLWTAPRICPVSGNCGAAANSTAVYIDESVVGGNVVTKIDIATGQVLYSSPIMSGFTTQNAPFLSLDGSVAYFSRTQNNTQVDFLFAFRDTGTGFTQLWSRPVRWTTSHEHALADDGSLYTFTPANEFVRLDPATGAILDNAGVLAPIGSPNLSAKTAFASNGVVFVSNGWASNPPSDGRMWAFNRDLSQNLFTINLDRQNAGGPVLGRDGTLVLADRTGVYAYRDSCSLQVRVEGPGGSAPTAGAVNDLILDCATASGSVLIAAGRKPGGSTPASLCGLSWNMRKLREFPGTANAGGTARIPVFVPNKASGRSFPIQGLDAGSCSLSGVSSADF